MASELSSTVTEGIRVNVRTAYVKDESSPKHNYFVFAYQVEIINESAYHVQLVSREWHITDSTGNRRMVQGDGVVGKQPNLAPGQKYQYVSGSHFLTPIGKMEGHYTMLRKIDGVRIEVQIPPFVMVVPYLYN